MGYEIKGMSANRQNMLDKKLDRIFLITEFVKIYKDNFPDFAVNIRLHWQQIMALGFKTVINIGCHDNAVGFKYPHVNYDINDVRESYNIENFVKGSLYKIPFNDGYFECSVMGDVLEHLIRPDLAIAEMRRVTSKRMVLTVPSKEHDDLYAWPEHNEKARQNFIDLLVKECKMDRSLIENKDRYELSKLIRENMRYETTAGLDHIQQFTYRDAKALFPNAEIMYVPAPLWCGFLIYEEMA